MVEADFNELISKSIEKVNRNTDVKIKDYMDENVIKTTNGNYIEPKNILNLPNGYSTTKYGVTVSIVNQLIHITGTWSVRWNEDVKLVTIPLKAGSYRLSVWNIEGIDDLSVITITVYNGTTGLAGSASLSDNTQAKFTITEDVNATINVKFKPGFTATNATLNYMLVKGLDKTMAYEEYFEPYYEEIKSIKDDLVKEYRRNTLYGKKWAVCGDSFSAGDFSNALDTDYTITEGLYKGQKKVYGYLIGNRNNMVIQNLSSGGRTMATPSDGTFTNCFSKDIYKTIDTDVDYITLYFGINDSHHRSAATGTDGEDTAGVIEIGTINDTDNTTFYGAWNVVIDYLITNYPNAHIGILVSNGCETDDYRVATIAVAKKFGIPYIDLNGDERTPCMIRSTNSEIASSVRTARTKQWTVNYGTNNHPNAQAHEYESIFIENFLRNL